MKFNQTRIYGKALELVADSRGIVDELPRGPGFLGDQLRRASASVVLNFAEGHDKGSLAEQRRFLRIARGSAQECLAILDVADRLGAISPERYAEAHEHADHLVRMLVRFRR